MSGIGSFRMRNMMFAGMALVVKNHPAKAGDVRDVGLIPQSRRSPGEGNGKPLQYSCLENPMDSMKRQNDRILKEELPRSLGAQYATGNQ